MNRTVTFPDRIDPFLKAKAKELGISRNMLIIRVVSDYVGCPSEDAARAAEQADWPVEVVTGPKCTACASGAHCGGVEVLRDGETKREEKIVVSWVCGCSECQAVEA